MTLGVHLLQLFSYPFDNNRIMQSIQREFPAIKLVPTKTRANKLEHHCLVVTEPHRRGKHRRAIMEEVGGDRHTINSTGHLLRREVALHTKDCRAGISGDFSPGKLLSLGVEAPKCP